MTTRRERLVKAKEMLSWSEDDSDDADELADSEDDKKVEKFCVAIDDVDEFFKTKKPPENRITQKYLKVKQVSKVLKYR